MGNRRFVNFIILSLMICLSSCSDSGDSTKNINEFSFWTVGSSGIRDRFGTDIYPVLDSLRKNTGQLDEFLFTIAEEPLTMTQIRERSGLSQSQVEYIIANLDSCNIIKKYNQNRWATTLPAITDNQMKIIRKDLAPMANSVAQYLKKEAPQIKTLYNKVKSPLDPSWEDISHLIIDKFIIDASFHGYFNKLKWENDTTKAEKTHVIPAFFLQQGENFANFGCNWYVFNKGNDQQEVFLLHGKILNRYHYTMNKYRRDQNFAACLLNMTPKGEIHSLSSQEKEMLKDLDWISGDSLLVPIIRASTIKSLLPIIDDVGKGAAEVAYTKFADMTDSYNKSTYSKFLDHKRDYIQALIHSLFGLTIENLVRNGTVPQIPEPVPESFGVYIVFGKVY